MSVITSIPRAAAAEFAQELGTVGSHTRRVRLKPERVDVSLIKDRVIHRNIDHQRNTIALGDGRHGEGHSRLIGTDQC